MGMFYVKILDGILRILNLGVMEMRLASQKYLVLTCSIFAIIVIIAALQVIYSPYPFVRALQVIVIIVLSGVIGAFIREYFLNRK